MKEQTKRRIKRIWKRFLTYAVTYAILPLFCGMMVALLFLINSVGATEAEALFAAAGEKTVMAAVGATLAEEPVDSGLYFLSPELIPQNTSLPALVGSAGYLTKLPEPKPEPETEEKVPSVIYDALPVGATPVVRVDLSSPSYFINTTKYTIDIEGARNDAFPCPVTAAEEKPLVLVLHTHGTECYFQDDTNLSDFAPEGVESYFIEGETSFRTDDPTRSVVQVGNVFTETLTELGVPAIHCTTMHDKDDFNDAYVNSAETVKAMLAQYPSIQYVIDLHRDSVVRGESWVKTYTEIEGTPSAQVMLVVGTNQNGRHPNWKQNLVVATAFKDSMDSLFPSLSRSLYLRTARFNQEYRPGCMLLEVGSAANTLEEAENAARFAARAFAQMLGNRS
ncbi:MAG: stage II sporulation protein P [Clostridia bacterium]|nr:stage II sporulation protein P [Clostridia bacterium]